MERHIDSSLKFDLQQNYRRYLRYVEQHATENDQLKVARSSRVWVAALITLVFALTSDFFLGASAALFSLYFYRILMAKLAVSNMLEGQEESERWFANKGLKFEGKILFFHDDEKLDQPLDPFDDALYS